MRFYHLIVSLFLLGASVACLSAPTEGTDAAPTTEAAGVARDHPMASFARMVSGEWRMGTVQADRWRWGPGERSMRVHTVGFDGGGNPWRELVVYYWRPDRKQVCLLGFHPDIPGLGRGVASGAIVFDGERAEATVELYQPGHLGRNRRALGLRWTFDGPDAYHEELLEDSGAGLEPLAEWDYIRFAERNELLLPEAGEAPRPSKNLKPFEGLLGQWKAQVDLAGAGAIEVESTFEWLEYLDVVSLRIVAREPEGEPSHVLDAFLYHHVGTDSLQCLALSKSGGVYEGSVAALEGGGLQMELRGFEGDRESQHVVHLEVEQSGRLRQRIWSMDGAQRTLMFDIAHTKLDAGQH